MRRQFDAVLLCDSRQAARTLIARTCTGGVEGEVTYPREALEMNAQHGGHVRDKLALYSGGVHLARAAEPPAQKEQDRQ